MVINYNKLIQVTCKNSQTNEIGRMFFRPLNHDVADRWLELVVKSYSNNLSITQNYRKIPSNQEILNEFNEFKENIERINSQYDRVLTELRDIEWLRENPTVLNDLHEEYEIYGDRLEELLLLGYFHNAVIRSEWNRKNNPTATLSHTIANPDSWPGEVQNMDVHNRMLRLNEQIHNFEIILKRWDNLDSVLCSCLVDYIPTGLHENLEHEDYFLFTSELKWGYIYLGYNTLGKHWMSTWVDNDIEVANRNAVRPQKRFAAEFYMHFRVDNIMGLDQIKFYKWFKAHGLHKKYDITRSDQMAFGFIPLAIIVGCETDTLQQIDIREIDNNYQQNWNKNVWSKYDTVIDVKILDK